MPHAPRFDRTAALTALAGRRFDVLVVGGGITGAGVALDAASRGLSTALVERDDFASGTSSASSKLVHGGLRYVSQGELGLVAQALAERQRLLSNAPHLVRALPFVLPLTGGAAAARSVGTALWLYDLAGGARIGQVHRRLSLDETRARVPALRADAFRRAYLYLDAHADDARLTLTVVRTTVLDHGAVAANHTAVVGLLRNRAGRVVGARVVADGQEIEVRAAVVVNAAGVWSDEVGGLEDDGGGRAATIRPAKGVHLTVRRSRLPATAAAVLPVASDGRSVFVIPWPGTDRVYVGTTDTDYDGDVDGARCSAADVAYLLAAVNPSLADPLTPADVVGCWAGLRPLVAGAGAGGGRTADLSRRHRLSESAGGVVTITGGKLTTYRKMAADTVDHVAGILGAGARSRTADLRLRGRRQRRRRVAGRPRGPAPSQHWSGPAAAPSCASGRRRPEGGPPGTAPSRAWFGTWSRPIARSAKRWSTASPTCGRRWCMPSATRWPVPSGTCSIAACGPASSTVTGRLRPRPTSPPWWDRSWAGPGPRPTPTWPSTAAPSTKSGPTPGSWPTTAVSTGARDDPQTARRRREAAHRLGGGRPVRGPRPGRGRARHRPRRHRGPGLQRHRPPLLRAPRRPGVGRVLRRPPPPRRPAGPRRPRLADVIPGAGRDRRRRPGHSRQERPRPLQPRLPRLHGLLHRHLRRPACIKDDQARAAAARRTDAAAVRRVSHLVVDVGTSGVRAAIVGADASVSHVHHRQVLPTTPNQGFVEFDAALMAAAALEVARAALAAAGGPVASVGIANQRASTVLWDRATGVPVGPGIGWQDLRTAGMCLGLQAQGIHVPPSASATKLAVLLDIADPDRRRDLCFGTIDTWMAWTLSGGTLHVTDPSNAGVTGMLRLDCSGWDSHVLDVLRIPERVMPTIVDSSGVVGEASALPGAPPIAGIAGDQQASLIGQGCTRPGMAKMTFGTGGMVDLNVGDVRPSFERRGPSGTFPIVAWRRGGRTTFGLEAFMLTAGQAVEWLRDDLGLISSSEESETIAAMCRTTGDVWFVPSLLGMGTPAWDFGARGTLVGLTRGFRPARDRPGRSGRGRPTRRRPGRRSRG